MKLELKHIAPYLPYGLKMKFTSTYEVDKLSKEDIVILKQIDEGSICVNGYKTNNKSYKPILHPLSELTSDNAYFLSSNGYMAVCEECVYIDEMRYSDVEKLIERHYDVFGLIEKGLAIDINTI